MITCTRYHDFSAGHRVHGHESHCAHLHGHNYRVHFTCEARDLDAVGRVIDFAVIKSRLCAWLEEHWDHRMLIAMNDPWLHPLQLLDPEVLGVPFNPTAEHMARFLGLAVGPAELEGTSVRLIEVVVEETRKCSARWTLER